MKHLSLSVLGALLSTTGFSALSQDAFPVLPVDGFSCNFQAGQDASDLDSVNASFNEWADGQGITGLTTVQMTPQYHSAELEYEVLFLDIWNDGATFGSGVGAILADPSSVADFQEVIDCPAHSLFALVGVQPPADGLADNGVFEFTDCTIKENRSPDDGIAAVTAIGAMWAPWAVGDAHGVMFPVSGESPDADYTFKWITYYPSIQAFGSVFDHYAAGAVQTAGAIIDPVMTCNSSRMYTLTVLREAEDEAS